MGFDVVDVTLLGLLWLEFATGSLLWITLGIVIGGRLLFVVWI